MKTLNGNVTNLNLLWVCDEALRRYQAGATKPAVSGVIFDGAAKLGHCQQNVREAVEATAYKKERMWGEASCCATATHQRLKAKGWESRTLAGARPGDVVYFGPGGGHCSICLQDPGHVGILHHQDEHGTWHLWQNTSYEGLGLCCIPLRESQRNRIVAIYRFFPLSTELGSAAVGGERKINWWGTALSESAVIFQGGTHYVELRVAAAAEGSVVKPGVGNKVYVGPGEWWGA